MHIIFIISESAAVMSLMTTDSLPRKSLMSSFSAVIFDIGDVLLNWTAETTTSIPGKVLKSIVATSIWYDYERGRISQDECYSMVGTRLSLDPGEIARAFEEARSSLDTNLRLMDFISDLKTKHGITIHAMSNISKPDFTGLSINNAGLNIFHKIYPSFASGYRKPELAFYRYVLQDSGVDPAQTIFIDDKFDNVLSARSVGMHGIVFSNTDQVIRALTNLLFDPAERARKFLISNSGNHESYTDSGVTVGENFAQILIFSLTGNRCISSLPESDHLFNFFRGKGQFTSEDFPYDLDTTSLAWTTAKDIGDSRAHSIMDEMLQYCSEDGIVQVYFDRDRPRLDPVVCTNVLTLFHVHGRGGELEATQNWVIDVLQNRAYLDGTRYYASAESFLYFFSRLISSSTLLYERYSALFAERVTERIGSEGDSLTLAMRITACAVVGVTDEVDLQSLLSRQEVDGSWSDGWFYKYGSSGMLIGNRGLTTAFALSAMNASARLKASASPRPLARLSDLPLVSL